MPMPAPCHTTQIIVVYTTTTTVVSFPDLFPSGGLGARLGEIHSYLEEEKTYLTATCFANSIHIDYFTHPSLGKKSR